MSKWGKFCLLYLGGVIISLSQLKVPPVMNELSATLHVSIADLSWLMSVFTISGIFIALPGGMIVTKIGAKKLLLGITGCLFFGNLIGAFVNHFYLLLVTRVIEGISFSTIVMTGVVLISYWFQDSSKSGTAIGIFTTFSALGSLIAMNIFAPMARMFGTASLWYFMAALSLVIFILFALFTDGPVSQKEEHRSGKAFLSAVKNKQIWLLALMQGTMAFVLFTFISIYPFLFTNFYGLSQNVANFYASLFGLFGIPFGILAGYLIDKTGRPGLVILSAFLLMAASCLAAAYLTQATYVIQIFALSVAASLASSAVTIMVPRVVKQSELIGYSMSIVNLFYYLGIVIGAPLITKLVEVASWKISLFVLTSVVLIGVFAAFIFLLQTRSRVVLNFNQEEEL
ncbi:nitrate/nitrite transporter [Listeria sp. PSOL-1]|uniref:MFS transporter n=1 Tax=Listeria sp. PSOL-1 TaxID=1844999 RepID=UPI0013D0225B|nr:MFS transporter [Listeria sp. PSOL-1]